MMKDKDALEKSPPAFQFYATDTLAKREFRLMNLNERGCYITLLAECWVNRTVPADIDQLSKFLGIEEAELKQALSDNVLESFAVADEQISSPELDTYKQKLRERREKQSAGGKKGQILKKANAKVHKGGPSSHRVEKNRDESKRAEQSFYEEGIVHEFIKEMDES